MPITRNCDSCGEPYTRSPSLVGRFCSRQCKSDGDRKDRTSYRRMRKAPDHPLAPASGLVAESRVVLFAKIGPGEHSCHWCGAPVQWVVGEQGNQPTNLIADHVDRDPLNDAPENLVAACWWCNINRDRGEGGRALIRDDEPFIVRPNGKKARGEWRDCLVCGTRFVGAISSNPKKGRTCSRSCARRLPKF